MSEVLNAEIDGREEKGGISRRRVAAGVAWSVPVILTTVAAPPASASPGPTPAPATPTAELIAGGTTLFKVGSTGSGTGNQRSGSCPASIRISNAGGGLVTGQILFHFKVTPNAGAPVGVGIATLNGAAPSNSVFGAGNVFEADFTVANVNGISSVQPLDLALKFNYQATNSRVTAYYDVVVNVTFTSTSKTLSISAPQAVKVNF